MKRTGKFSVILLLLSISFFALSCSESSKFKLPPGRCQISADCPLGQTCRGTVCEDIYYPENEIHNY